MRYPRKVYAIRHNVTNRVYIGSSANPDVRFAAHLSELKGNRHSVKLMQEDYNKHGDDYTFSILDTITNMSESEKEYEWMKRMRSDTSESGYNYHDKKWVPHSAKEKELLDLIDGSIDRDWLIDLLIGWASIKHKK